MNTFVGSAAINQQLLLVLGFLRSSWLFCHLILDRVQWLEAACFNLLRESCQKPLGFDNHDKNYWWPSWLEALSRGSVATVLVESNKMAAAVCIKNARTVQDALSDEGQEVSAKVQIQPVQKFLETTTGSFDLVFIDPPYELTNQEVEKNLESLRILVSDKALVLVERSSRVDAFSTAGYELVDQKPFGDTVVYWLKPA
jgi:hypothetical protein